jgi:CheY-like chemotaxis protein
MSKIEANKLELSPVCFDFEKTLREVTEIIEHKVNENRQKLQINIAKDIPAILYGDDQRLSQVVTNLLSNAVKFTPEEGSIHLDARLLSEEDGVCHIKISVADTGIGITAEQKLRLFESFEQADASTSRHFGGTGLGLAISKRIVEMMDGDIWVDSEPGNGSTFTFTVALTRNTETPEISMRDDDDADEANVDFSGRTILLAEDVEINREIVTALLSPLNLTFEYAENGAIAVEKFTASPERFDIIIMDVQMPQMDGYEATRRIRALDAPNADTIPIIAMTANVFREDIDKCLAAGMSCHIGKPIDYNDVVTQLKQFLS